MYQTSEQGSSTANFTLIVSRRTSLTLSDDVIACCWLQTHPKFASIAAVAPLLFSRELQVSDDSARHDWCIVSSPEPYLEQCQDISGRVPFQLLTRYRCCGFGAERMPSTEQSWACSTPRSKCDCATSQQSCVAVQLGAEKKAQRRALGDAVEAGVIANETLAYFIGRTYLFMERIGINTEVRALSIGGSRTAQAKAHRRGHDGTWHTDRVCVQTQDPVCLGRPSCCPPIPRASYFKYAEPLTRAACRAEVTVPAAPAARDGALCGGLLGRGGGVQLRLG